MKDIVLDAVLLYSYLDYVLNRTQVMPGSSDYRLGGN